MKPSERYRYHRLAEDLVTELMNEIADLYVYLGEAKRRGLI